MANARVDELMSEGRRWVYDPDEFDYVDGEGYAVRLVFENEPGYFLMDWRWGNGRDFDLAERTAEAMNSRRGIDKKESLMIVASSMFAKARKVNDEANTSNY